MELSDFSQHVVEVWGASGADWLRRLPTIIEQYAQRWSLTVQPPFDNLSYNYVAPAVRADGTPCVLKLGVTDDEARTQIPALRLYAGRGSVRLLEEDAAQGAMLLERLIPGTLLAELEDDAEATAIAAALMRELWQPAPAVHPFPQVADWAKGMTRLRQQFEGGTGPFPRRLVEQAEALFAELLPSMDSPVVLHGDLHHFNILAAERQPWLALDPKGILGEPVYEVGAWLRNPIPALYSHPNPVQLTRRRVDQLADLLGFDRQRILGWGLAQAVLSAWWSLEDEGYGWEGAIAVAEWMAEL